MNEVCTEVPQTGGREEGGDTRKESFLFTCFVLFSCMDVNEKLHDFFLGTLFGFIFLVPGFKLSGNRWFLYLDVDESNFNSETQSGYILINVVDPTEVLPFHGSWEWSFSDSVQLPSAWSSSPAEQPISNEDIPEVVCSCIYGIHVSLSSSFFLATV